MQRQVPQKFPKNSPTAQTARGSKTEAKQATKGRNAGGQKTKEEERRPSQRRQRAREDKAATTAREETPTQKKGGTRPGRERTARNAEAAEKRDKNRPETPKPNEAKAATQNERTAGRQAGEATKARTRGDARTRTREAKTADRRGQREKERRDKATGHRPDATADKKTGDDTNSKEPKRDATAATAEDETGGTGATGRGDGNNAGDHTGTQRRDREPTAPPAGDQAKPGSKRTEPRRAEETTDDLFINNTSIQLNTDIIPLFTQKHIEHHRYNTERKLKKFFVCDIPPSPCGHVVLMGGAGGGWCGSVDTWFFCRFCFSGSGRVGGRSVGATVRRV